MDKVLLGQHEQVGVADTADVRRPTIAVLVACNYHPTCPSDMERVTFCDPATHIDRGIQRPGDPVDPVTLLYNELQMSTYVADKRLQWARGLPVFIAIWRLHASGK